MKVRAKKNFSYSKDGVNALQAVAGEIIEDFPDSEYEGCRAAGLVELDTKREGAKKSQENEKAAADPDQADAEDETGGDEDGESEKKTETAPNGSQTGKDKSVVSSQAAQAPKASQKKSGGNTKAAK